MAQYIVRDRARLAAMDGISIFGDDAIQPVPIAMYRIEWPSSISDAAGLLRPNFCREQHYVTKMHRSSEIVMP